MSEPERPFLPMSWELGGEFMSGMADSIRERRARERPFLPMSGELGGDSI